MIWEGHTAGRRNEFRVPNSAFSWIRHGKYRISAELTERDLLQYDIK
jgi:hypothetical protein